MRPDLATALSVIDQVIGGCQQCAEPLDTGGPSVDFCSEDCQTAWHETRAATAPTGSGTAPDESLPETTPVRPLGWLGPPPPGAVLREGHQVLDEVRTFLSRFSAFPSEHCAPTLALWYAHTTGW